MRILLALLLSSGLMLVFLAVLAGLIYLAWTGSWWALPLIAAYLLAAGYFAYRDRSGWGV